MGKLTEIRWHGRAGQGVVTAGELLAEAAMEEGKYFQAFPDYGPERMGAPIKSYTRISDEPIEVHHQILYPDVVIVVNPNLIGAVNLIEGLKEDGTAIINTPDSPAEIREKTSPALSCWARWPRSPTWCRWIASSAAPKSYWGRSCAQRWWRPTWSLSSGRTRK